MVLSEKLSWKDYVILIALQGFFYMAVVVLCGFWKGFLHGFSVSYHQYHPGFSIVSFGNNYVIINKIFDMLSFQIGTICYVLFRSKRVPEKLMFTQIHKMALFSFFIATLLVIAENYNLFFEIKNRVQILIYLAVILIKNFSGYMLTVIFLMFGNKYFYKKTDIWQT